MRGHYKNSRRRGVAIVYIVCIMTVMLGFCSLAVDLGRVQTGKTELRRAADAAARAAIANLYTSTGPTAAAISMAANDKVDGKTVTLTAGNISVGVWTAAHGSTPGSFSTSGTANNTTSYNAVQVTCSQQIPLLFGVAVGASNCTVNTVSTAALVSVTTPVTDYVAAHGNPWLAGEPSGTKASVADNNYTSNGASKAHPWNQDIANPTKVDTSSTTYSDSTKVTSSDYASGEPWGSPVAVSVTPGAVIQISVPDDSNNMATNSGFLDNTGNGINSHADGAGSGNYSNDAANPNLMQGSTTTSGSEKGIANIITPLNSMLAVFTDTVVDSNGNPTSGIPSTEGAAPPGKDFSTQAARDYITIEPQLRQPIYVGDGQTSSGSQQTIIVPAGATQMYLGTMDGHEWSNNQGGFNATITEFNIEIVH